MFAGTPAGSSIQARPSPRESSEPSIWLKIGAPIVCERIAGLARLLRAYALAGYENIALWHERDISHSSVERVVLPDSSHLAHYVMRRMGRLLSNLVVFPERMQANLDRLGGLHNSQRVLLALTQAGVSREDAYRLVQRNAMKVWEEGKDFKTELLADPEVTAALSPEQIEEKFDLGYHTKHVDTIFKRVFGEG